MTAPAFAQQLERYGPDQQGSERITLAAARSHCRELAQTHYENFTVASWLLPRSLRPHFQAIYAYCRWADDLADEVESPEKSLELLDWWEAELLACFAGDCRHPVFVALAETIREFDIPAQPFLDLLIAFRQDQTKHRYETLDELLAYCANSANPVGRLVLYLGRCHDEPRGALSDKICTGLQLVNFWQDMQRDWQGGRLYLPRERMDEHGVSEADLDRSHASTGLRQLLQEEVDRARALLALGRPLAAQMPGRLRFDIELFTQGGLAICEEIEHVGYDVLHRRPIVSQASKIRLALKCLFRMPRRRTTRRRTKGGA